jgi:hypothetical protein
MSIIAIACYRPFKGREGAMKKLVKRHAPLLRREKLITSRASLLLVSGNGIFVEMFEWASKNAKIRAHRNPQVLELWGKMAGCGRNVSLSKIREAGDLFANLEALR